MTFDQLSLDDALAWLGGFDEWEVFAPNRDDADPSDAPTDQPVVAAAQTATVDGLTVDALARTARCSRRVMAEVVANELERGHVERDGDDWRATPRLLAAHGRGFRLLALAAPEVD